jgi:hypothetical protein
MSLAYPNIVPENNLRLPDALTIKHGPAPLLARFILEADKAARAAGIHLRLRNDFDTLDALNQKEVARGAWYPLVDMFNPQRSDVSPENAFWLSGENERGEIVCTNAARIFFWPDSTLADQVFGMFYARDEGQPCVVTAEAARTISGVVQVHGATWVRPDYRSRGLSHLLPRVCRAYGPSRWPIDWVMALIRMTHYQSGVAFGYGARHFSASVTFPELHHLGEMVVAYSARDEVYDDLRSYLATDLPALPARNSGERSVPGFLAQEVINTSPEGPRQGSSKRS